MTNKKETEIINENDNYNQYFTESSEGLDIEANNINANCITSRTNKFSIDEAGNINCNSITTNNQSEGIDFDKIYPVGSIYLNISNVNPENLFGGSWVKLADRFLVGAGASYASGSKGGAVNHKHTTGNCILNVNQIPSHNHGIHKNVPYGIPYNDTSGVAAGEVGIVRYNESYTPFTIENTGGNQAHNHGDTGLANNIPPYLAVYMWQRVS